MTDFGDVSGEALYTAFVEIRPDDSDFERRLHAAVLAAANTLPPLALKVQTGEVEAGIGKLREQASTATALRVTADTAQAVEAVTKLRAEASAPEVVELLTRVDPRSSAAVAEQLRRTISTPLQVDTTHATEDVAKVRETAQTPILLRADATGITEATRALPPEAVIHLRPDVSALAPAVVEGLAATVPSVRVQADTTALAEEVRRTVAAVTAIAPVKADTASLTGQIAEATRSTSAVVAMHADTAELDRQVIEDVTTLGARSPGVRLSSDPTHFNSQIQDLVSGKGLTEEQRTFVLRTVASQQSLDNIRTQLERERLPGISVPIGLDDADLRKQLTAIDSAITQRQRLLRAAVVGRVDLTGIQLAPEDEEFLQSEIAKQVEGVHPPPITVPVGLDDENLRSELAALDRNVTQRQRLLKDAVAGKIDISGIELSHEDQSFLQHQIEGQVQGATTGASPRIHEEGKKGGFLYGQSFGESVGQAVKTTLLYGGAFAGISGLFRLLTGGFSQEELQNQANASLTRIVGKSGDAAAVTWAGQFAHGIGQSTTEALTGQAQFTQVVQNLLPKEATDKVLSQAEALDKATGNLANRSGQNFQTVQNQVTSFLSGSKDALKDYGISLTDAQQGQEALAHGFGRKVDQANATADARTKVSAAQQAELDAERNLQLVHQRSTQNLADRQKLTNAVTVAQGQLTVAERLYAQRPSLVRRDAEESARQRLANAQQSLANFKPTTDLDIADAKQKVADAEQAVANAQTNLNTALAGQPTYVLTDAEKSLANLYYILEHPPDAAPPSALTKIKDDLAEIEVSFAKGIDPALNRFAGWFDVHGEEIASDTGKIADATGRFIGFLADHSQEVLELTALFTALHEVRDADSILNKIIGIIPGVSNPAKGGGGFFGGGATGPITISNIDAARIVAAVLEVPGGLPGGGGTTKPGTGASEPPVVVPPAKGGAAAAEDVVAAEGAGAGVLSRISAAVTRIPLLGTAGQALLYGSLFSGDAPQSATAGHQGEQIASGAEGGPSKQSLDFFTSGYTTAVKDANQDLVKQEVAGLVQQLKNPKSQAFGDLASQQAKDPNAGQRLLDLLKPSLDDAQRRSIDTAIRLAGAQPLLGLYKPTAGAEQIADAHAALTAPTTPPPTKGTTTPTERRRTIDDLALSRITALAASTDQSAADALSVTHLRGIGANQPDGRVIPLPAPQTASLDAFTSRRNLSPDVTAQLAESASLAAESAARQTGTLGDVRSLLQQILAALTNQRGQMVTVRTEQATSALGSVAAQQQQLATFDAQRVAPPTQFSKYLAPS